MITLTRSDLKNIAWNASYGNLEWLAAVIVASAVTSRAEKYFSENTSLALGFVSGMAVSGLLALKLPLTRFTGRKVIEICALEMSIRFILTHFFQKTYYKVPSLSGGAIAGWWEGRIPLRLYGCMGALDGSTEGLENSIIPYFI